GGGGGGGGGGGRKRGKGGCGGGRGARWTSPPSPPMPMTWCQPCSPPARKNPSRRTTRCRRIAYAGNTSSASTRCATATSPRPRGGSTCIAAPCSGFLPSARRARPDNPRRLPICNSPAPNGGLFGGDQRPYTLETVMKPVAIASLALLAGLAIGPAANAATYTAHYDYVGKPALPDSQIDPQLQADTVTCDGIAGVQRMAPSAAYRSCMRQHGWKYRY